MKKKPLQAILIAGERQKNLVEQKQKKITIREGLRDYELGIAILCCHILNWATKVEITSVTHTKFSEVSLDDLELDGFNNHEEGLESLKRYYPNFNLNSEVTIIKWEYLEKI